MNGRFGAAVLVTTLLLLAVAVACQATPAGPGPGRPASDVQPAAEPTATAPAHEPAQPDEPATETVWGTVTYRERTALGPEAVVEVTLSDVSRADAPAIVIGKQVLESPGQVPIVFEIEYDPAAIDDRFTYAVQARITEGGRLSFINDTAYHVITRGNPTEVEMVLVKVGRSPEPPAGPADPEGPEMAETPAPIESVEVAVTDSTPPEYLLKIVSGLPSGCVAFNGYGVKREGNGFAVGVTNLAPVGPVACTTRYGYHEGEVSLGSALVPGETYTVRVNGEVTNTFTPADPEGPEMAEAPAAIEGVEVAVTDSSPPEYLLKIVSGVPGGCVAFNGYRVARGGNGFTVGVTNLAPVGPVACTTIYGYHEGEVSLGSALVPGETYTVRVNGEVTNTFTPADPEGPEMAETPAPIESVEVAVTDSSSPEYLLKIVSGVPGGCVAFNGYGVKREGNGFAVGVTNLAPAESVPCTTRYGYHAGEVSLGSALVPGETYTVRVNGEVTNTFTPVDPEGPEMALAESPIERVELDPEPLKYRLHVLSRLPLGSSCSRPNGYDVSRPSSHTIRVTVTHFEVVETGVPCTDDLPVVETVVHLGSDFLSGQEYRVIVNGEVAETFAAR